jgi:2-amino-4-hydroxy-6-hydroxymethyldihydropteridine diphosphokinase
VARLRALEERLGRDRPAGDGGPASRCIDLDLLLYGERVTEEPVALPRGDIHRYPFVARPLADLAPQEREPATGATFAELWAGFPAGSGATLRPVALELPCPGPQ